MEKESNHQITLGPQWSDRLAAAGKGLVGWMPWIGPILAEAVGSMIPNQRLDRVESLLKSVQSQLSDQGYKMNRLREESEARNLLEAAIVRASQTPWDEKIEYFANLLVSGLTADKVKQSETIHLMKLLEEINDIQLLILRSNLGTPPEQDAFVKQHPEVFKVKRDYFGGDPQEREEATIFNSYKQDLERLGLLRLANTQHAGRSTVYELAPLGRTLLKRTGLAGS